MPSRRYRRRLVRRKRRLVSRRRRPVGSVRLRRPFTYSRRVSRNAFSGEFPGNRDSITVRLEQRIADFQVLNSSTPTFGSFLFRLSDLTTPTYTSYTSEYAYYRINWISYKLSPSNQIALPVSGTYSSAPDFIIAPDRTLTGPSVTAAEALSWPNRKMVNLQGSPTTLTFRPTTFLYGYGSGSSLPTYTPTGSQWIPTTDLNFPHLGIKFLTVNFTAGTTPAYAFRVHVRMSITFKERD